MKGKELDDLQKVLRTTVLAHENGRQKRFPKMKAIYVQVVNKAVLGDLKPLKMLLDVIREMKKGRVEAPPSTTAPAINIVFRDPVKREE